ncbi:porin [Bacterioplanes sanyensis]|uniref:Porin n=1 Tax=Bacterioplanes sanyensis TaxID=1249553 RepID=A0A222FKW7_9GAMM|nr:DcaP family trimeric outer membrane transporter [Bacterioplanes sanyensis]ASP39399.1 porin [Bacterioplanes sanyensis]
MRKFPSILLAAAVLPVAVHAANTEFSYGGYIKLDAMMSTYSDGDVGSGSIIRDFYVPSGTPVSGGSADETTHFDMHAKTSRLNFKTNTDLGNGHQVMTFIEMDFLASAQGNEVVSNSYSPRLRHAFVRTGPWTFGQTWSTFMNVGALPETVDFLGVSDGTVFARQTQIRYTRGGLQVALENPETTVGGAGVTDDAGMPDVVARYNINAGDHSFTLAAIGRQLAVVSDAEGDGDNEVDETTLGVGFNVSGKVMLGKDDLKFSFTKGNVARYVGLAAAVDAAISTDGDLEATDVTAAFVGFRHHWSDQWRSTLAYSMMEADFDDVVISDTEKASSWRVNLMYSPVKKLTYGVEYSQATHENVSGADGDMSRIHFTTKYVF